jgi:cob(I)alamin adenosyltransferase
MVVLNKIYTRTGDDGTTALGSGQRLAKDAKRVEETNAVIGMARHHITSPQFSCGPNSVKIDAMLGRIQNDLFDLGADLCVPDSADRTGSQRLRITPEHSARLEAEIDELNGELAPLTSFVLPGGAPAAAVLHLASTTARRAERRMVTLAAIPGEHVNEEALRYINRLSDFLFVASRSMNESCGFGDVLWVPGANR